MNRERILVCDDEPAARRGAVRALGTSDYDFVECGDGRACVEMLSKPRHGVDLVLLDLRMPGMDGMTTLGHITALASPPPAPPLPPIIVVTADTAIDLRQPEGQDGDDGKGRSAHEGGGGKGRYRKRAILRDLRGRDQSWCGTPSYCRCEGCERRGLALRRGPWRRRCARSPLQRS